MDKTGDTNNGQSGPADENMRKFLDDRVVLPEAQFPFVGSYTILNGLFDVINMQVFNSNLDGVRLEWCDKLRSRAVIAYEQITSSTKQTFIRCSKDWFKNRSRRRFVEALLYELIQLYIQARGDDSSPDLVAYALVAGIKYFNIRFGTNLILNYNYKPLNDDTDVKEILASIVDERTSSTGKIGDFTFAPEVKLLTERIVGNPESVECNYEGGCGALCYATKCPSAVALRKWYFGSNIYFIFTIDQPQCFLCEKAIRNSTFFKCTFQQRL